MHPWATQIEWQNKGRVVLDRGKITQGKSRNLHSNLKAFQANFWKFSLPTIWCLQTPRWELQEKKMPHACNWTQVVDSGFHAPDSGSNNSGFFISGTWILDSNRSRNPESKVQDSRFPYLGRKKKTLLNVQKKQESWICLRITGPRFIGLFGDRNLNMKSQETYLQHLWLY